MRTDIWWAASTAVFCVGIMWACICRLNVMRGSNTKMVFRVKYATLLGGAAALGASPQLFGIFTGPAGTIFSSTVLFYLAVGMEAWKDGPPAYTFTRKGLKNAAQRTF